MFELRVEELPLMEAAEARHGSKRGALLAALRSQARAEDLEHDLAEIERQVAAQEARKHDCEMRFFDWRFTRSAPTPTQAWS